MKLIIAGGRDIKPTIEFITGAMLLLRPYQHGMITEVISGGASGVDNEGEHWAGHSNVPVTRFEADWNTHGKAAGPIRNKKMAEYGDVLMLIWDGESRGSGNMKSEMEKIGKPVFEVVLRK